MTAPRLTAASTEAFRLAEGPVWDPVRRRLLWVDMHAGQVLESSLDDTGSITVVRRHAFDSMVGAVIVAEAGTLLVAAQEHLIVIETDGTRHEGARIVPSGAGRRLNDGSTDPSGRFVGGTLSLDGPHGTRHSSVWRPTAGSWQSTPTPVTAPTAVSTCASSTTTRRHRPGHGRTPLGRGAGRGGSRPLLPHGPAHRAPSRTGTAHLVRRLRR
ncbi:hypothetical protein AQJ67_05265 [Streptomyces caeruleatus]|uniref:SMP-30/Gluconolactonase/LRE-like region domain-containing protein n=1 Tax=Streptomyces caeruleatus TaxID=661399 RepID=A0A101U7K8_9ACTN|nr:hypothetical protein AQJ67_05265 [Streptomyces caeruleatus]